MVSSEDGPSVDGGRLGEIMLQPGSWIAGYRVERALGSGGMGAVYLAKHPELPRSDAIKVLGEQVGADEQFRKRFLREAEVAAGLDHPNIVTIYNRGRNDGMLWIAMQYVPGTDCAQELHRAQEKAGSDVGLPPERVVRIAGSAEAIAARPAGERTAARTGGTRTALRAWSARVRAWNAAMLGP